MFQKSVTPRLRRTWFVEISVWSVVASDIGSPKIIYLRDFKDLWEMYSWGLSTWHWCDNLTSRGMCNLRVSRSTACSASRNSCFGHSPTIVSNWTAGKKIKCCSKLQELFHHESGEKERGRETLGRDWRWGPDWKCQRKIWFQTYILERLFGFSGMSNAIICHN